MAKCGLIKKMGYADQMTEYQTLVDLLGDRAQKLRDQNAYTFLADGETESGRLTYGELDQQAKAIAAEIRRHVPPGTHVLVVYPYTAGLEFIAAFFGCLYAGVVAVTDNPPRSSQGLGKLQERMELSEAKIALTSKPLLSHIQGLLKKVPELGPKFEQLPWITTDTLNPNLGESWSPPDINPETLAFLQYTSGSTGTPKGVMVTHQNVLHNSEIIDQAFEHTEESQGLIWLPLFHDMGLIGGVIQPLYGGFPVTLMSPVALVQKPMNWLKAISRYAATTSGGPNFAYDLLWRQASASDLKKLDLSSWEVAFCGAEPIRAETLDNFAKTFAECGFRREAFYPCYGMAETTLFISGGRKADLPVIRYVDRTALEENKVVAVESDHPGAKAVVGCGRGWLGDEIAIANPETLTRCAEGEVGEIWLRGGGIGLGYWNNPSESDRTFKAKLDNQGSFLRTGDLGFWQNGELFITGRMKEMMILWGRNHYPQHIEQTLETCHDQLRPGCGAAFSIEVEEEERLVIAYEVQRQFLRKLNVEEVIGAIREAIADQHLADVFAVVLLKTGTLPKTTSGKVQRQVCRRQFLAGTLEVVGQWQYENLQQSNISDLVRREGVNS
ncbi:probable acyl-CoA synthase [Limnospira platensis NIES-39]|nr:probable acyl-CoA synthase [Arthrospira platensis NIES-39]